MRRMKRTVRRSVAALAAVLILGALTPVVVPIYRPWIELNCVLTEVNIATGHLRKTRSLWYLEVSQWTEENELSRTLTQTPEEHSDAWRAVAIRSFGTDHSPQYKYSLASRQISQFNMLCGARYFTNEARQTLAKMLVESWATGGSRDAHELIQEAWTDLRRRHESVPKRNDEPPPNQNQANEAGRAKPTARGL